MSHFVVGVIVPAEDVGDEPVENLDLEGLVEPYLAPYHEYECTGVDDEYVIEVDCTDDAKASYEKYKEEGQSFEDYAASEGYTVKDDGKAYCKTNPNPKWDWWVVGGRWSGCIVDAAGKGHNALRAKDWPIRIELMREIKRFERYYDDLHAVVDPLLDTFEPWSQLRLRVQGEGKTIEEARTAYHAQPAVKAAKEVERFDASPEAKKDSFDGGKIISGWGDSLDEWVGPRDKVVRRKAFGQVGFFAYVDEDGWHARGEMGWFGMSDDHNIDGWADESMNRFMNLDPEDLIVAVDCHI